MIYKNKIICGDSISIMKEMPDNLFDTIYTDPVWPDNKVAEFTDIDPFKLFAAAAVEFPRLAKRVLIHLGCDSDPRILAAIPKQLPFFRTVSLRYAFPHFKGRVLYDRDIVYAFGPPPPSRLLNHAICGEFFNTDIGESRHGHPCPRRLSHVHWLLSRYANGSVFDPFAGVCTTAVACVELDIPYCCIEINEKSCETGRRRVINRLKAGIQLSVFEEGLHHEN